MSAKKVWAEHPDLLWDLFDVVECTEVGCTIVSCSTGLSRTAVSPESLVEVDPSHLENSSDLCAMNSLHEAPLIDLVRRRYRAGMIFSNIGSSHVVVSLNPYRYIPGLFEIMDMFDKPLYSDDSSCLLPPHIYGTANIALKSLATGKSSQSILISGESGAGKTEASKAVVNFLIHCDTRRGSVLATQQYETCERVKRVLKSSTAIFEAFGNAKTIKNDNSSRFGKFIKLNYSDDCRILSAETETFLLERSRLVSAGADERNYHIFYMMISALRGELGLKAAEDYQILRQGGCTTLSDSTADTLTFEQLLRSFRELQFTSDTIFSIWRLLSVILDLGNLKVVETEEGQQVHIEDSLASLETLSGALGVHPALFKNALTTRRVLVANRASINTRVLSVTDAVNNIKGMIKWLYNKLFEWLVKEINEKYKNETVMSTESLRFIGILDIFGFEVLGVNSLEQLCINYTNERLQDMFNERIFVFEQEEYLREGLEWKPVAFSSNKSCIDCIAKQSTGILQQLEEYGSLNRKGENPDDALLTQFHQTNEKIGNSSFVKSRFKDQYFTIRHYAGDVVYGSRLYALNLSRCIDYNFYFCRYIDINGFVAKNNFALTEDLMGLLVGTSDPFLSSLFQAPVQEGLTSRESKVATEAVAKRSKGAKKRVGAVSLSSQFRQQVDELMLQLKSTEPHYIKVDFC